MTFKIKVYSDFVCPFCYLGKSVLDEVIQGDFEVEMMPFELRPSPAPLLDPVNDPEKQQIWKSSITPMAARLGVDMKLPNVSPHPYTHLAFEGMQFAKEHGKASEYSNRIFTAFYQEDQNIGEVDILASIAKEIGLDKEAFTVALTSRKYKEAHQKELKHAYEEAQITAVPTFFIGDERIEGVVSKEYFERVIQNELNKQKNDEMTGRACGPDENC